jgi:hypothetical protein
MLEEQTPAAKAATISPIFAARLKSCPSKMQDEAGFLTQDEEELFGRS